MGRLSSHSYSSNKWCHKCVSAEALAEIGTKVVTSRGTPINGQSVQSLASDALHIQVCKIDALAS